jgi:peptide deformylase
MVLVNPVLKLDKSGTETYNEGCLSFPKIYADIRRPTALSCRYQDVEGNPHALVCDGLLARVIQHEVDHLNGILFIDRMPKSTVKKLWPQLEELKWKGSL